LTRSTWERNFFEVIGNVPGRRDAGRVYSEFVGTEVIIIAAVYVDDNLIFHTVGPMWESFLAVWHVAFEEHEYAAAISNEFAAWSSRTYPTAVSA
jgi:hypothetical protein